MSIAIVTPRHRVQANRRVQDLARAPDPAAGTFARESHIDDLAYRAGVDPVDFRLGLLDDERLAAVIEAAAKRFGWQFPWCPAGGPACGPRARSGAARASRSASRRAAGWRPVPKCVPTGPLSSV